MPQALPLTDLEGHILAQLARLETCTTYDIMRALGDSMLAQLSASAGAIYPAVKRLRERGFIGAKSGRTGQRQHAVLRLTAKGSKAARGWIASVRPGDLLPTDPLRTKLMFHDLLSPAERAAWVAEMRAGLTAKLKQLRSIDEDEAGDPGRLGTAAALAAIRQRRSFVATLARAVDPAPTR